jgi:segregation and condensation protein A
MTAAVDPASATSAAAIAAWEDPPRETRRDAPPVLAVAGFTGPLDWLLEMVQAQKIDLARLSIAALIEAFARAMTAALTHRGRADPNRVDHDRVGHDRADPQGAGRNGARHPAARIEHWAAWTVMAASLTELWSRLLLPPDAPAARSAAAEAEALRRRLLERARMRAATDWLARQPQLGQVVFARGGTAATSHTGRGGDPTDLLRACLVALQVPPGQAADIRPRPPRLWAASDAIRLMRQHLAGRDGARPLSDFLPPLADTAPHRALRHRAALASTLVAGLELAREQVLTLEQDAPWATIQVTGRTVHPATTAATAAGPAA